MHEYSLMENVVQSVLEKLKETPDVQVKELELKIGVLDIHSKESFEQAFQALTKDTMLEGTKLSLLIIPGKIHCASCGFVGACHLGDADGHDPIPIVECPNCSSLCRVQGGRGIECVEFIIDDKS